MQNLISVVLIIAAIAVAAVWLNVEEKKREDMRVWRYENIIEPAIARRHEDIMKRLNENAR